MMISSRPGRAALVAGCVSLGLAGCSATDAVSACADTVNAISQGAEAIAAAASDPATAGEELREFAEDLRSTADEASDDEIRTAATNLAELYEGMADDIENGEVPDVTQLEGTVASLQEACT